MSDHLVSDICPASWGYFTNTMIVGTQQVLFHSQRFSHFVLYRTSSWELHLWIMLGIPLFQYDVDIALVIVEYPILYNVFLVFLDYQFTCISAAAHMPERPQPAGCLLYRRY